MLNPNFFPLVDNLELPITEDQADEKALNILDGIIEKRNVTAFKAFRDEELKTEHSISKLSKYEEALMRLLAIYGVEDINIKKIADNLYEIPINKADNYQKLDSEYAYKGGAARNILEQELGFKNVAPARDLDLAKIVKNDNIEKDRQMAKKYSPDDLKNGHGVENLEEDYFETRDFTINELLVTNNKIILTKDCLLDTARGIIRFTDYEKRDLIYNDDAEDDSDLYFGGPKNNNKSTYLDKYKEEKLNNRSRFFVNDKLMAKALRLFVNQSSRRNTKLSDEELYQYLDINNFHIALHLDRALEQGYEIAVAYIEKLIELGQLNVKYDKNPEKVLKDFIDMIREEDSFVFRFEAIDILDQEKKEMENLTKLINMAMQAKNMKHIDNINDYL